MPRHHGAVPDATNSKAWILILSLGVSLFVMESAKDDILTAMDVVIWTQDGSLIRNRKTIYFSFDRFLKDIVHGNRCFICGANPELVPFNDEHVLPDLDTEAVWPSQQGNHTAELHAVSVWTVQDTLL